MKRQYDYCQRLLRLVALLMPFFSVHSQVFAQSFTVPDFIFFPSHQAFLSAVSEQRTPRQTYPNIVKITILAVPNQPSNEGYLIDIQIDDVIRGPITKGTHKALYATFYGSKPAQIEVGRQYYCAITDYRMERIPGFYRIEPPSPRISGGRF
ncbi:hypothetical protein [uncultured Methylobacterium sp.]|uniref:hypothetical protein n=1 Tax=uncultured Methylobacterium sp. TaxID=157278 RepID=UPI0035C946E2